MPAETQANSLAVVTTALGPGVCTTALGPGVCEIQDLGFPARLSGVILNSGLALFGRF